MSYAIDTASKVHERQVAATEDIQSFLLKTLNGLAGLRSKAPQAPESVSAALGRVSAPLTKRVGTPDEVQGAAVAMSRDWLAVQHTFQRAFLDALDPSGVTVEVPANAAAKKKR